MMLGGRLYVAMHSSSAWITDTELDTSTCKAFASRWSRFTVSSAKSNLRSAQMTVAPSLAKSLFIAEERKKEEYCVTNICEKNVQQKI